MPTPLRLRCTCGHLQQVTPIEEVVDVIDCDVCGAPLRVFARPPGLSPEDPEPDAPPEILPERPDWDDWEGDVVEIRSDLLPLSTDIAAPAPIGPAAATNLAGLHVEWTRYYRSFPSLLIISCGAILVGMTAVLALHQYAYLILTAVGAGCLACDIALVRQTYRLGEVRPGVVVSTHPPLVAVSADLASQSGIPRPAIKILRQPLQKIHGGTPPIGTLLAAVAIRGDQDHFHPQVVRCATSDEVEIGRVTGSLGQQDWNELQTNLSRCSSQTPGLHTLWDGKVRRPRWIILKTILGIILVLLIAVGLLLPLVYFGPRQNRIPAGGPVPGRVHTDWGR
jgi:hypothetical protein